MLDGVRDGRFPSPFRVLDLYEMCRWTEFNALPRGGGLLDQDPEFFHDFRVIHPIATKALSERAKKQQK